jgi:hypothetical protein
MQRTGKITGKHEEKRHCKDLDVLVDGTNIKINLKKLRWRKSNSSDTEIV